VLLLHPRHVHTLIHSSSAGELSGSSTAATPGALSKSPLRIVNSRGVVLPAGE
jgi:hypothetical protein